MNDIKEAIKTALNKWEGDEHPKPTLFKPTNNVSRETFNYIKAHPNSTTQTLTLELAKRGFKPTSTSTLVAQMVRQRMVSRDDQGRLRVLISEYQPLSKALQHKTPSLAKWKYTKHAPSAGIAALQPQAKGASLLDTLSVVQARALYDELKKIFGG